MSYVTSRPRFDRRADLGSVSRWVLSARGGAGAHLTIQDSPNLKESGNFAKHHLYVTRRKDSEPQAVRRLLRLLSSPLEADLFTSFRLTPTMPLTLGSLSSTLTSSSTENRLYRRISLFGVRERVRLLLSSSHLSDSPPCCFLSCGNYQPTLVCIMLLTRTFTPFEAFSSSKLRS